MTQVIYIDLKEFAKLTEEQQDELIDYLNGDIAELKNFVVFKNQQPKYDHNILTEE